MRWSEEEIKTGRTRCEVWVSMMRFAFFFFVLSLVILGACGKKSHRESPLEVFDELEVIEVFPQGTSVPVHIDSIGAVFSRQVTFSFSITPYVRGELSYDAETKKVVFKPLDNLSYNTKYTVRIEVKDIYHKNQKEVSWEFQTAPEDRQVGYSVFVPACFKDEILVEVSFPSMSSVHIYVNSLRVVDVIASGGSWGFEISRNLKEGENIIEVEIIPVNFLFPGMSRRFFGAYKSLKDSQPPTPPLIQKRGRTEFYVVEATDDCGITGEYRLFLFDEDGTERYLGGVANEFDTIAFAFEGGEICVRAVDVVGNVSECSNRLPQGFRSSELDLLGFRFSHVMPKWNKVFFLRDGEMFFKDGANVYTLGLRCDRLLQTSEAIICQGSEKVFRIGQDLNSRELEGVSYVSDVCLSSDVFCDGVSIFAGDNRVFDIPANKVACSDDVIVGYSESTKKLYVIHEEVWSKEITSLHFFGRQIIDEGAKLLHIFPVGPTFAMFFTNVDLYALTYKLVGEKPKDVLSLKKVSVLVWSTPFQVLSVKDYGLLSIREFALFSGLVLLLVDDQLVVDPTPFSGGDTTRYVYNGVDDIGLTYFDLDDIPELYIVFRDGRVKVVYEN